MHLTDLLVSSMYVWLLLCMKRASRAHCNPSHPSWIGANALMAYEASGTSSLLLSQIDRISMLAEGASRRSS